MDSLQALHERLKKANLSLTEKARQSLILAAQLSSAARLHIVAAEHVVLGLVRSNSEAAALLSGVSGAEQLLANLARLGQSLGFMPRNPTRRDFLDHAMERAGRQNRDSVDSLDLMSGAFVFGNDDTLQLATHREWGRNASFRFEGLFAALRHYIPPEPSVESQQLLVIPGPREVHIMPIALLARCKFASVPGGSDKDIVIARASIVEESGFFLAQETEELERLINQHDVSEEGLHQFFERHPKFLLGCEYKALHSKVVLESEGGSLIPDFFLEKIGSSFADIVDLKLPNVDLMVGPTNRRGFCAALTRALDQLREYRNFFDAPAKRDAFHAKHGFTAFRPRISVIIGRDDAIDDPQKRIAAEEELRNLRILTYDEILARAKGQRIFVKKVHDIMRRE